MRRRGRADDPPFVVVGHITRPHGTKGEFFVWSLTDRPESTFAEGELLRAADEGGNDPDELLPPLRVAAARPFRKGYLVNFEGVDDRNRAELLRGRYLLRPFEEIEPLDEGEVFYHQLLGMRVVTKEGVELGPIREVFSLEPVDLLELEESGRLLPFTREVVVSVDPEEGVMIVDPPEGLLDL